MQRFIVRRILWNIPVLIVISIVTFGAMQIVPGGPFTTGGGGGRPIPPEVQENMRVKYGLDKPVWEQYLNYMGRLILHFDFGPSLRRPGRTVNQMLFGDNYLRNVLREQLLETHGAQAHSMTFIDPP